MPSSRVGLLSESAFVLQSPVSIFTSGSGLTNVSCVPNAADIFQTVDFLAVAGVFVSFLFTLVSSNSLRSS